MRRRTLLRRCGAGAAGLAGAGCLGVPGEPAGGASGATDTPTRTPRAVTGTPAAVTRTPGDGMPRTVSLAAAADAELRDAYDVAAEVTVTEPRVTGDHTASADVRLRNRGGGARTLTYRAEECDLNLLDGCRAGGDACLLLAPAGLDWAPASEGCWRVRHRDVSCGIPATTHEVELPAGGTTAWRFGLWATPKGRCMPPGRYRFRRRVGDGGPPPGEDAPALTVVLRVAAPDA